MRCPWWLAATLLGAALLLLRSRPAALPLYVLLLLWAASALTVRAASRRLRIRQRVAPTHLSPGQRVDIEIVVESRSRLPIPWLWVREPLPVHLEHSGRLQACTAVAGGGSSSMRFALRPGRRGRYRIGRVAFRLGDWFGLSTLAGELDFEHWVTVYPAIVRLPPFPAARLLPVGPRQEPDSPFRDELASGVRDYVPGDPLRAVAWKASARHGQLKVREFPRVRERSTTLALDLHRPAWISPVARRCIERALSVAASYVWAEPADHPLGLIAYGSGVRFVPEGTGAAVERGRWLWVKPRPGLLHRRALLELLAGIDAPDDGPPLHVVLGRARGRLLPGEALVVLTSGHDTEAWTVAADIASRGHPVTILGFERRGMPPCPGARVMGVSPEGDVQWA